jgi:cytochrome bd ubiquinol oxidase subunit I
VLTAAQAASKVPAANIALTLAMYVTLYLALLSAYVSVVFHLARKATLSGKNTTNAASSDTPQPAPGEPAGQHG